MTGIEHWLQANSDLLIIIIVAVSFIESFAIVGVLVPGILIVFAASSVAATAGIPMMWVLSAAFTGAVLGDGISYFLGYHYHETIRRLPLFQRYQHWFAKGETFFHRYGWGAVVIGRFIGPLRPIVPLIAGAMQMPPVVFYFINILSALVWAPFFLVPGYYLGLSLEHSGFMAAGWVLFVVATIICGLLLALMFWATHEQIYSRAKELKLTVGLALICFASFLSLSQLMQLETLINLNLQLSAWLMSERQPWLDQLFVGITQLGYFKPMALWAGLVALAIIWQRNGKALVLWLVMVVCCPLSVKLLKLGFAWPRPQLVELPPASFAFPSGHTQTTLVYFGTLAILLLSGIGHRPRQLLLAGFGMITALVAASRLYLGVHWFTDIIGGLLMGGCILSLLYGWAIKQAIPRLSMAPVLVASVAAWGISFAIWIWPEFAALVAQYAPKAA